MFTLLKALAAAEARQAVRQTVRIATLYAAAGVFALATAIFLLLALFFYLETRMTPVEAALWIAGGLFLVCIILAIVALVLKRRRRGKMLSATLISGGGAVASGLADLPAAGNRIMRDKLYKNAMPIGIAALIAGFLFGRDVAKK